MMVLLLFVFLKRIRGVSRDADKNGSLEWSQFAHFYEADSKRLIFFLPNVRLAKIGRNGVAGGWSRRRDIYSYVMCMWYVMYL